MRRVWPGKDEILITAILWNPYQVNDVEAGALQ